MEEEVVVLETKYDTAKKAFEKSWPENKNLSELKTFQLIQTEKALSELLQSTPVGNEHDEIATRLSLVRSRLQG